ncbi:MAG: DUF4982 domain-containing protein [Bacteroidales bacterium]|nr:DUF4982 domain-containing protein [Bacteroidales bacterium]
MRKLLSIAVLSLLLVLSLSGCRKTLESPRDVQDFNFEWKFTLGDNESFADYSFDDSSWRDLHLPHDWSIEGEFSADNPSTPGGGALPGGIGWYRKHFTTPEGKHINVEFDGVFMNSTVYVNGKEVGTRPYGYSSFSYDITSFLNPVGEDNTIAVRCDNQDQPNSRWYAGCGIYRNVRIVSTTAHHVAYNGTYVTTPEVSTGSAKVKVEVEIERDDDEPFTIQNRILNNKGKVVAEGNDVLTISKPHFWDVDDPYLYTMQTIVKVNGEVEDVYNTRFGVKTAVFDVDKGFFLNGKSLKLLGVCLHHDMGCLGTAVHRRALERELTIMKDMGVNSIRTSHNPPAPELLELCDEMGILVLDEAFDMWRKKKTQFDYARFFDDWHERDLKDFIKRDRNHASVFMWSIGNEIQEQWNSAEDNLENLSAEQANLMINFMSSIAKKESSSDNPNVLLTEHMVDLVKEMDPTRPVTAGCNDTSPSNNLIKSGAMDVYGFNYHPQDYDRAREWYPGKPLFGSETISSINSRGVYFQPSTDISVQPAAWWLSYETPHHQCTAYDASRVPWGNLHEEGWIAIRDRDFVAGTYVWTGFDYLGEPTPYSWPSRSSYFGIVDLAGFPKDPYWMYQSEWTDKTVLHLLPHWNWNEGDKVDIWAYYSNADEVELFVNGKSLGKSSKTDSRLHAFWGEVPFEPGKIEVVSYKGGKEVARESHQTSGEPVRLQVTLDRDTIDADGYDLCYATIEALDSKGRVVPTADAMLEFSVSGEGELVGVDNGNAADTMSLKGNKKAMFSGKALAVVRSIKGEKGIATLSVSGLGSTVKVNIKTK